MGISLQVVETTLNEVLNDPEHHWGNDTRVAFIPFALDAYTAMPFTPLKEYKEKINGPYKGLFDSNSDDWSTQTRRGRPRKCFTADMINIAYCGFEKRIANQGTDYINMWHELDRLLTADGASRGDRSTVVIILSDGGIMGGMQKDAKDGNMRELHAFYTARMHENPDPNCNHLQIMEGQR